MQAYGFEVQVETKIKDQSAVQSAFVKGDTVKHLWVINAPEDVVKKYHAGQVLKIKFEVDTNPPPDFETEEKLHLHPMPFMIKTMKPSSLFAGKLHALLCRGWQNRPKGRDWYDLVWYVQRGHSANIGHLAARLIQSCKALESARVQAPASVGECNKENILSLLMGRINTLDIEMAKQDVRRFIADERELNIWSREFFGTIAARIQFETEKQ